MMPSGVSGIFSIADTSLIPLSRSVFLCIAISYLLRENRSSLYTELIHEHIIPRLLGAVFEHSLEIGTVVIRARHGTVDISVENKNVVAFRILIAHTDLPFDGLFCLPLAGIARIDDCCFHNIVASFGYDCGHILSLIAKLPEQTVSMNLSFDTKEAIGKGRRCQGRTMKLLLIALSFVGFQQ